MKSETFGTFKKETDYIYSQNSMGIYYASSIVEYNYSATGELERRVETTNDLSYRGAPDPYSFSRYNSYRSYVYNAYRPYTYNSYSSYTPPDTLGPMKEDLNGNIRNQVIKTYVISGGIETFQVEEDVVYSNYIDKNKQQNPCFHFLSPNLLKYFREGILFTGLI